jgi:hypothetical protein
VCRDSLVVSYSDQLVHGGAGHTFAEMVTQSALESCEWLLGGGRVEDARDDDGS